MSINTDEKRRVLFGSYPKGRVIDAELTAQLNLLTGALPADGDSKGWTSYRYYIGRGLFGTQSNEIDYMWYMDVEHGGEKYRAVYFDKYRPDSTSFEQEEEDRSLQFKHGYCVNCVHWFKFEPIGWVVTDEQNGECVLYSEWLIDAQAYQNCYAMGEYEHITDDNGEYVRDENGDIIFANNYEYSTVRKWLNSDFMKTAFNSEQTEKILVHHVDNSIESTGFEYTRYACRDTDDKVFLFSTIEAKACTECYSTPPITDYAKCQGAIIFNVNKTMTWLRSPWDAYSFSASMIYYDGNIGDIDVTSTMAGIRPAVVLSSESIASLG